MLSLQCIGMRWKIINIIFHKVVWQQAAGVVSNKTFWLLISDDVYVLLPNAVNITLVNVCQIYG